MSSIQTYKFSPSMIHGAFEEDKTPCVCGHPRFFHPFNMKCRRGDCKQFKKDVSDNYDKED